MANTMVEITSSVFWIPSEENKQEPNIQVYKRVQVVTYCHIDVSISSERHICFDSSLSDNNDSINCSL